MTQGGKGTRQEGKQDPPEVHQERKIPPSPQLCLKNFMPIQFKRMKNTATGRVNGTSTQ